MQTKLIMSSSAFFWSAHGVVLMFAPEILPNFFGLNFSPDAVVGLQFLGAALFGFGQLNWVGRNAIVGGIYGRAIVGANFTHAVMGFFISIKAHLRGFGNSYFWVEVFLYFIFAAAFTMMLYGTPARKSTPAQQEVR